jgi:hypothetical protein
MQPIAPGISGASDPHAVDCRRQLRSKLVLAGLGPVAVARGRAGREERVEVGLLETNAAAPDSKRWHLAPVNPIPYGLLVDLQQFGVLSDGQEWTIHYR